MAEKKYVEQEAVIKAVCDCKPHTCRLDDCGKGCQEVSAIISIPAADVRPVRRGQWEDETGFIFSDLSQQVRCSKCGLIAYFYDKMPMNFCPNCGAVMEEN